MRGDRYVGELWCHETLALLSQYLDGELDEGSRARIVGHVSRCDVCARFGERFGAAVAALRAEAERASVPEGVHARLLERLRAARAR